MQGRPFTSPKSIRSNFSRRLTRSSFQRRFTRRSTPVVYGLADLSYELVEADESRIGAEEFGLCRILAGDSLPFLHVQPLQLWMDERKMSAARELTPERSSAVPLRVDHVTASPAEPTVTVHCTDTEGTKLRVAVPEPSALDPQLETGQWYRFDGVVRAESPGAELLCPSGDSSAERIDAPERRTHPPLTEIDDPWLVQLEESTQAIAVTVQPRPTNGAGSVRADDPETFEIGAVCFAHCGDSGDTTVYHREEPDTRDEHLLLEHVVEDLSGAAATLVARGGGNRQLALLYERLALAAEGDIVETGAERVLEGCFHANPERVVGRAEANTLVEVAQQLGIEAGPVCLGDYDTGLDPADWRANWALETTPLSDVSDPQMTDQDYSVLVERYLGAEDESVDSAQLAQCLKAYASADLDLLCGLVTAGAVAQLGCPRLSGRGRSG